ncbi:hypothetical protein E2C01_014326 [Portunus trituberculatus]|uniref:Uncharacterized protein n=1 Tax=Portunus trituberculatus TaxID=210409 RepID=A0A5B7DJP2_PORTR|nr:hypothetical protein [Portunus trituberculatus]
MKRVRRGPRWELQHGGRPWAPPAAASRPPAHPLTPGLPGAPWGCLAEPLASLRSGDARLRVQDETLPRSGHAGHAPRPVPREHKGPPSRTGGGVEHGSWWRGPAGAPAILPTPLPRPGQAEGSGNSLSIYT